MQALEFGMFDTLLADEFARAPAADSYDAHLCDAKRAESLGYKYYFFIEHQNAGFSCIASPNVYLAALARETRTLRFGAMVYQIPLHHPVRLAQDAAVVDHLSRGRVEFAIGYGTRAAEFERWNVPYGERREIGIEAMEVVLRAWAEKEFTYHGAHWKFDRAQPQPQPFQKPHPPIWIGAHSPQSFDYAAQHNFNVAQNLDTERVIARKFDYFRKAWRAKGHAGPMPRTMMVRHVHVAETDGAARAEAEPFTRDGLHGQRGVARAMSLKPEEATPEMLEIARVYVETAKSYDFWIDEGLALIGSPETVIRRIRAQQASTGIDLFVASHQITTMPLELARKSLELFGRAVIPAFAVPVERTRALA